MNHLAVACFFLSGVAGLILEVLWTKTLTLVFGSTTLAVSTTVASFMGGLSLGSLLAPRLVARGKNPFAVYAALELLIGLYALAVPHILGLMPPIQAALWPALTPHPAVYSLVRFAITFMVLVLPTTAMGATLPVLASYFVKSAEESGIKVGYLYALNTFGALVGTMLAGFWLLPAIGVRMTNLTAAAIDVLVAGLMFMAGRVAGVRDEGAGLKARQGAEPPADGSGAGPQPSTLNPQPCADPQPADAGRPPFLFVVALLAGFASMALQVLWTRALSVIIGSSTYAFTIILSAFLAGITIGAAVFSRILQTRRDMVGTLVYVLGAIGVSAFFCGLYIDRLPFVLQKFLEIQSLTMTKLHLFNWVLAWLVIFLPTLAMGALFPLLVHLCTDRPQTIARDVGRLYAVTTLGNILGSVMAGFVIIPVFGIASGLLAMVLVYLGLAAAVALRFRAGDHAPARLRQAAIAVGLIAAAVAFTPRWDVARWASGMFRIYLARSVYSRQSYRPPKVVYHRDGMVTTVTVEQREAGISMKVNGKVDASNGTDMHTQILSGMWPMLLHGGAKDVAMVGLGSGVTAGAILRFPVERFRVIELEAAVDEGARFFAEYNHRYWEDPRLQMVFDDGRNYLAATKDTFDVIVSEPSNPWVSGASNLFTQEFWTIAERRLRPGGIFAQWLQLYELSAANIKALINTYHSVFPHVLVFHARSGSNDTIMIGSNKPIVLEWGRLAEIMARPGIREEFARAEAFTPHDLLALLLLDETSIPALVAGAKINTDDNSLIEFAAPKDLLAYAVQDADMPPPRTVEGRLVEAIEPMVRGRPEGADAGPWLAGLARALMRKGRYAEARRVVDRSQKVGPSPEADLAAYVVDLLDGEERIFPFDTVGREGAGEKFGYLIELLSGDNYAAAYTYLSPPDTGELVSEKIIGAHVTYPKPAVTGKPALDFLRGYILNLMGGHYEALYLYNEVARDPRNLERFPMLDYHIARSRLGNVEYVRAVDAMERYAAWEKAEIERSRREIEDEPAPGGE